MTDQNPMNSKELYLRLLSHVRPYRGAFLFALLAMVCMALIEPALASLVQPLLDDSFVAKDPVKIYTVPLAIVALYLLKGITHYISVVAINWVGQRVVMDLRNLMFTKMLNLPTRFYHAATSGSLMSRFTYDANQINAIAAEVLIIVVRDSLVIVGLFSLMLYQNWKLTMLTLVITPVIGWVAGKASRRQRMASNAIQEKMGDMTHITEEAISGHKVVKVFHGEQYESDRFAHTTNRVRRHIMRLKMTSALFVSAVQLLAVIAVAIIIYAAASQATFSVGEFGTFLAALSMLLGPLKRLTNINEKLQMGLAASRSVFEFIDEPAEIDTGTQAPEQLSGAIRFEGVGMSYDGDKQVLHEINLDVAPGETVALVGQSGSGKSTLASLLPRFYNPTTGRIVIDDMDITDIKLEALRKNISYVSQEIVLFNDTIAHNIAYGSLETAEPEQIERAAHAAHAMEFIEQQTDGMETQIGGGGLKLSGGQRQRIAIARAILKDAPILILDEATSALDSESEKLIQEAIEKLKQGKTSIIIAHRLSTIINADKIIVLERGRIVESGTHAELLGKNGTYAAYYHTQSNSQTS